MTMGTELSTSGQSQQASWAKAIWPMVVSTLLILGVFALVFALTGDLPMDERIATAFAIAFVVAAVAAAFAVAAVTAAFVAAFAAAFVAVFAATAFAAAVFAAIFAAAVAAAFAVAAVGVFAFVISGQCSRETDIPKAKLLLLYGAQVLVIWAGMYTIVHHVP